MTVSGTWGNLERLEWTRSVKARQIDEPDQVDSVHIGSICAMENNGVAALHNLYTAMDVAIKWERYMCCRLIATVQLLNHFYPCVCQSLSVCYRLCAFWIEAEHFRIINVYYWTQSKWPSNLCGNYATRSKVGKRSVEQICSARIFPMHSLSLSISPS